MDDRVMHAIARCPSLIPVNIICKTATDKNTITISSVELTFAYPRLKP
jgi:hypothetical protein